MADKFLNKYRVPSARLQQWDYGWNGSYFVTICAKDHVHCFGEIQNGRMRLNELGFLAEKYWHEIPNHFPFVELGDFVVMPNHIHGILTINKPDETKPAIVETPKLDIVVETPKMDIVVETPKLDIVVETPKLGVSTGPKKSGGFNQKWKPATLGVIINQYKRIITIQARKLDADFAWQPRFHDHIIRNENSYHRIANYIRNNPLNWREDKFYT